MRFWPDVTSQPRVPSLFSFPPANPLSRSKLYRHGASFGIVGGKNEQPVQCCQRGFALSRAAFHYGQIQPRTQLHRIVIEDPIPQPTWAYSSPGGKNVGCLSVLLPCRNKCLRL